MVWHDHAPSLALSSRCYSYPSDACECLDFGNASDLFVEELLRHESSNHLSHMHGNNRRVVGSSLAMLIQVAIVAPTNPEF